MVMIAKVGRRIARLVAEVSYKRKGGATIKVASTIISQIYLKEEND